MSIYYQAGRHFHIPILHKADKLNLAAMSKILLVGNNEITSFLKDSLSENGRIVEIENLGEINNFTYKDLSAIIDLTNAKPAVEDSRLFIHNTGAVKQLMDAAKVNNAPYLFIYKESINSKPEDSINIAIDFISQYGKNDGYKSTIIQIEDIYGQDINTSESLNELISNIISNKPIKIKKDINDLYLMHQGDFVSGISKILSEFETNEAKTQYTLFNPEPITEIEMVHFIKDLTDLKTQIEYSDEPEEKGNIIEAETSAYFPNNWMPTVNLETGIKDLFKKYDIPLKGDEKDELSIIQIRLSQDLLQERAKLNEHYEKKDTEIDKKIAELEGQPETTKTKPYIENEKQAIIGKSKAPKRKILQLTAALILILALPSFGFIYTLANAIQNVDKAQKAFNRLDLKSANEYSKKAYDKLHNLDTIPRPILFLSKSIGLQKTEAYSLLNTSKNLSEMIYFASSFVINENNENLLSYKNVLGATNNKSSHLELDKAFELANIIESDISHIYNKTDFQKGRIQEIHKFIQSNKSLVENMKNINPILREILGYTTNQTYLLLFQNTNEIRANGGKVKEYAILKVVDGNFNITKLGPISELDAQLELNNALGIAPNELSIAFKDNLMHIKDSMWYVNFKESAIKIHHSYENGTKSEIDGVIAINYSFLESLPNINHNKSLGFVLDEIFKNGEIHINLIKEILGGLQTKDIQIYNKNEKIMKALSKAGWTGELNQSKAEQTDDYIYIVDTNLGQNHANKDIEKSVSYKASLPTDDFGLKRELIITYKNTSTEINSGNSEYLNYLRIVVPKDALLNSASLITDAGEINITRSINVTAIDEYAIYSTDISIMPDKTVSVILRYESKPKTYNENYFELAVQKQPGSKAEELNIEVEGIQKSIKLIKDEIIKLPL